MYYYTNELIHPVHHLYSEELLPAAIFVPEELFHYPLPILHSVLRLELSDSMFYSQQESNTHNLEITC